MRLAPRIACECGTDGVFGLSLDDEHYALLIDQWSARETKPASTSPSMKEACAGRSDC